MAKEVLYNDDYIELSYDTESAYILKNWKKPVPSDKFREIIIQLLMTIINTRIKYPNTTVTLLVDARRLGTEAFTKANIDWLDSEIHPMYTMNKIPKKAFVISSDDMSTNLSVVQYATIANNGDGLKMNVFSSMEEATDWLLTPVS
ncbi:MAG: hypothetical protein ACFB0B_21635 [Thermonemataceae bacterium]